jgi:ubiquinone/menaquinone biosynthesis C-methylase UbiE
MNKSKDFQEKSYQSHETHFNDYASGSSKSNHAKSWLRDDTVDAWRHQRMRLHLMPLINEFPQSSWLTVGDGRYGTDAHFLKKNGIKALATDISDVLLKEGKELGFIDDFSKENAEKLSFEDNQFDFVYCKEAYHHFPRPMIALYEMIRVAKKGVILTEPKDATIGGSLIYIFLRNLKDLMSGILGKDISRHSFEESGNYVYSISEREIQKAALGINLGFLAFKVLHDSYQKGVEYEKAVSDNQVFKKVKRKIALSDLRSYLGLSNGGLLTAMIFKTPPSQKLQSNLKTAGFKVVELPKNPYL